MKLLPTCTLALLFALPTLAGDFYVDASYGNDAQNSGLAPNQAFRTITHALSVATTNGDHIYVYQGAYDTAHGEVFPILPQADVHVRGVGDVVIESPPAPNAWNYHAYQGCFEVATPCPHFRLSQVRLKGGLGIKVFQSGILTVEDVAIQCDSMGILVDNDWSWFWGQVTLKRVQFHGVGTCFHSIAGDCGFQYDLQAEDCVFKGVDRVVNEDGLTINNTTLRFERCHIDGVSQDVVDQVSSGTTYFLNCLIENVGGDLVKTVATWGGVVIHHSTILAPNRGVSWGPWGSGATLQVRGSIVLDPNFEIPSGTTVRHSLMADPQWAGSDGNIYAYPEFVDAAAGDYTLSAQSPCVDTSSIYEDLDFTGHPRGGDGNLDTIGGADMGCFERHTLFAPDTVAIGDVLSLEIRGEPGKWAGVFLDRSSSLMTAPTFGPFGACWVPSTAEHVTNLRTLSDTETLELPIPTAPGLVGEVFRFQVLARTSGAMGAAWTDPCDVLIQ